MFRFTIRDVLWLMVVVALAISWRMDRLELRRQIVDLKIRLSGGIHGYLESQALSPDKN